MGGALNGKAGTGTNGTRIDVVAGLRIRAGAVYRYTAELPAGCAGGLYRVARFVLDVPAYQQKVLVEALTGQDRGLWFTASPANFSMRYAGPVPPDEVERLLAAANDGLA
jgi:hypothetical protein